MIIDIYVSQFPPAGTNYTATLVFIDHEKGLDILPNDIKITLGELRLRTEKLNLTDDYKSKSHQFDTKETLEFLHKQGWHIVGHKIAVNT